MRKTAGSLARSVRGKANGAAVVVEHDVRMSAEASVDDAELEKCRRQADAMGVTVPVAIEYLHKPGKMRDALLQMEAESRILSASDVPDPDVAEFRQAFDSENGGKIAKAVANGQPAETLVREASPSFNVPLELIDPTPDNARKMFDKSKLESLAASIKANGQDVPCKVRRKERGRFLLVDGERRFRAAKLARLEVLRCEIIDVTDEEARERGLIINLQREDLNPIERAIGYKQLLDDGLTQEGVAKRLGLSGQAVVSNAVRLLELPDEIKNRVASGELEQTAAVPLIPFCRRGIRRGVRQSCQRAQVGNPRPRRGGFHPGRGRVLLSICRNSRRIA